MFGAKLEAPLIDILAADFYAKGRDMSTHHTSTVASARPEKHPLDPTVRLHPVAAAPAYLRFYLPERLHAKTLATLALLEQACDCTRHHRALAEVVVELTECGLRYYFLRPLQRVQAGALAEQATIFGLNTIKRLTVPVAYSIISQLTAPQLLGVCQHIRELMA